MSYFIGLDIGTSATKALLCDQEGKIVAISQSEFPLYTPQPLWSEQDPEDWWQGSIKAIQQLLVGSAISTSQITGIGLTGQMHGSVFLDRKNQVIRPALLWNDQRTAAECEQITTLVGYEHLIKIAGNPALTGFQAPKILWLRNNEPQNYERVAKVLLPKDYIRFLLTGEYASDCSDAAGTLLLDLRQRDWSKELLQVLDLPRDWFPTVYEGSQITGHLLANVAEKLGLPAGIPVVAGGGDNAAAAVGTGIVRSGLVSSSIGTSGVVFAHSDDIRFDPAGRLHTFCHAVPGKYHLMAVTLSAGNSLRWLRDLFRTSANNLVGANELSISYDAMTNQAAQVSPGAEGLIFLPYLTGERTPHLDPLATGAFIGLTARHTAAHLVRAVMEGVTFSLRDGFEIMHELQVPIQQVRAIGGGGKSPFWCQIQADIFGTEVINLAVEEGPAYGAALLSIAADQDAEGVTQVSEECVKTTRIYHPQTALVESYHELYGIYRELYPTLKESMHKLSNFAVVN
ncbi:MAG: xylulokinase [Anaerolineaceae bacterium]|nr:xylulokinase [Anaerolineaceae bacterium]